MKFKLHLQLCIQLLIILGCVLIMAARFSFTSTSAQIQCSNQPPVRTGADLIASSWRLGPRNVSVTIFNTNANHVARMSDGIRYWNDSSTENCSQVVFNNANSTDANYVTGTNPPTDNVWVTRDSGG